jgi:hypothetical protein
MARQRSAPKAEPDLKKAIEDALGEELAVPTVHRLNLFTTVGAWSLQRQDAFTTSQGIVVVIPKSCSAASLVDVDGFAATGSDGKAVFRLSKFVCLTSVTFGAPLNIEATPLSTAPVYLTAQRVLVDNASDVEYTVFSWAPDGSPAPNVFFDWRSRVSFFDIVV